MKLTATTEQSIRDHLVTIAQAGGGELYTPAVEYAGITEPFYYPSNIRIIADRTIYRMAEGFEDTALFKPIVNRQSGYFFDGLTIDLNGNPNKAGIINALAAGYTIQNCIVTNPEPIEGEAGAGIDNTECFNYKLLDNTITNMSGHAIANKSCHDWYQRGNEGSYSHHRGLLCDPDCYLGTIEDDKYHHNRFHGVHNSHGTHDMLYRNVWAYSNKLSGFSCQAENHNPETTSYNNTLDNCRAYLNGENGLILAETYGVAISGARMTGNVQNGIRNVSSSFCTVTGSHIEGNGYRAYVQEGVCIGNTFMGNLCKRNGADGVWLYGGSAFNTVVHNRFFDNSQIEAGKYYGSKLTSDGLFVPTDNDCTPNQYFGQKAIYAPSMVQNRNAPQQCNFTDGAEQLGRGVL